MPILAGRGEAPFLIIAAAYLLATELGAGASGWPVRKRGASRQASTLWCSLRQTLHRATGFAIPENASLYKVWSSTAQLRVRLAAACLRYRRSYVTQLWPSNMRAHRTMRRRYAQMLEALAGYLAPRTEAMRQ